MNSFRISPETILPLPGRFRLFVAILALGMLAWVSGCSTTAIPKEDQSAGPQTLSPGDVVKISFPASPTLDNIQTIRRDGLINLPTVGEIQAADRTPAELEKELLKRYAGELVSKEITVTVVSSSFAVFVSGAVLKPGKIIPDRAITALEAIMEAGGFDTTKANPKAVVIIRYEGGQTKSFTLNLKDALDGKPTVPFYLKSHDIVVVPEKFVIF
jgi:polysaccharide export outer membrane protein